MSILIVIPSRLGSTRLDKKPLVDIQGEPLIVRVWRKAVEAQLGPVIVACDHESIAELIQGRGGQAILTGAHNTGSDRVYEAVSLYDPEQRYHRIINLQGDLPFFPIDRLKDLLPPLDHGAFMSTLIKRATGQPSTSVKVHVQLTDQTWFLCKDFNRNPKGSHIHLGVYGFTRDALRQFAGCPQSSGEKMLSLEQRRALDQGWPIAGVVLDERDLFINVDTPEDLQQACLFFQKAHNTIKP